jgi:hypothetical protein
MRANLRATHAKGWPGKRTHGLPTGSRHGWNRPPGRFLPDSGCHPQKLRWLSPPMRLAQSDAPLRGRRRPPHESGLAIAIGNGQFGRLAERRNQGVRSIGRAPHDVAGGRIESACQQYPRTGKEWLPAAFHDRLAIAGCRVTAIPARTLGHDKHNGVSHPESLAQCERPKNRKRIPLENNSDFSLFFLLGLLTPEWV